MGHEMGTGWGGCRYEVTGVSFSCCRLEADVSGITALVSSVTRQPRLHSGCARLGDMHRRGRRLAGAEEVLGKTFHRLKSEADQKRL